MLSMRGLLASLRGAAPERQHRARIEGLARPDREGWSLVILATAASTLSAVGSLDARHPLVWRFGRYRDRRSATIPTRTVGMNTRIAHHRLVATRNAVAARPTAAAVGSSLAEAALSLVGVVAALVRTRTDMPFSFAHPAAAGGERSVRDR